MDDDVGYGLLRVTRDQRWKPFNIGNLLYNVLLALFFEWGIAAQHLELGKVAKGRGRQEFKRSATDRAQEDRQAGRQGLRACSRR